MVEHRSSNETIDPQIGLDVDVAAATAREGLFYSLCFKSVSTALSGGQYYDPTLGYSSVSPTHLTLRATVPRSAMCANHRVRALPAPIKLHGCQSDGLRDTSTGFAATRVFLVNNLASLKKRFPFSSLNSLRINLSV